MMVGLVGRLVAVVDVFVVVIDVVGVIVVDGEAVAALGANDDVTTKAKLY